MFPLKVLNRLNDGHDIAAELTPTLPNHKAWILIRPQVNPEKAEWDKVRRRWWRVYVEEGILAGYKVNYVEIEIKQIDSYFIETEDNDIEPTINERFSVASEEELADLVSQWTSDFSIFLDPYSMGIHLPFDL